MQSASDEVAVTTIFQDPKDFLLQEEEQKNNLKEVFCPEIKIKLNDTELMALLDTGAKISAISEDFFITNKEKFQKCPKFPIVNLQAVGFSGEKSNK